MNKDDARSSRRLENPRDLWGYVVFIMGTTLIGALLSILYCTVITAILVHPASVKILLVALGTFGLSAIVPSSLFLGVSLAFLPANPKKRRITLAFIILAAGLLGSYLFQTIRPFDFYHEANGSRPGWEPFALLSRTSAIAVLTSLSAVSTLSKLTRNFTL
jgi:hypothetical protein